MNAKGKGYLLVFVQFALLAILIIQTKIQRYYTASIILILLSVLLISWAIISMRKSRLRILPIPAADAVLITKGPYKWIRHPMYTGLLLFTAGLLIIHFSWLRLLLWMALLITLLVKLHHEEQLLKNKFSNYRSYTLTTYSLLPFIY